MSLSRQRSVVAAVATSLATALGFSGCNLVFRSTPAEADAATVNVDATTDGMPGTQRIDLKFGNATSTEIEGEDSSVSNDALHLWFMTVTTPTDRDMQHAQRATANALFGTVKQLDNVDTGANEVDGAIMEDQLFILYASNAGPGANGATRILQGQRQSPALEFTSIEDTNVGFSTFSGFDASPDGLQIFYVESGGLKSKRRTTRDNLSFSEGPATKLSDGNISYPTVSFDRLELVYVSADGTSLMRALLSADGSTYGEPQVLDVGATCGTISGPDFSPNAMLLTFTCDKTIYVARRPAP